MVLKSLFTELRAILLDEHYLHYTTKFLESLHLLKINSEQFSLFTLSIKFENDKICTNQIRNNLIKKTINAGDVSGQGVENRLVVSCKQMSYK